MAAAMTRDPTPAGASAKRTPSPEPRDGPVGSTPASLDRRPPVPPPHALSEQSNAHGTGRGRGRRLRPTVDLDSFIARHAGDWQRLDDLSGRRHLGGAE